jgi:hypothetical protein
MMKRREWSVAGCVMLMAAVIGIVGCESTDTTGAAITLTPSSATITDKDGSVVFVASAASTNVTLYLPLVWSVSDPKLGTIVSSGGLTAVYRRDGSDKGGNGVIVRDQVGAEGVAAVNQQ